MTFSILDAAEMDRRPNPNFWSVILLFLHKQVRLRTISERTFDGFCVLQVIQEIQALTQVTTDVGYSRAFVRKAVNECLLSSYFQNIRKAPSTLKSYYQRHAFLFDTELVETIENLLKGTESFVEFDLPCNSSLLNVWGDAALQMSGIYSVPLRSLPIASGEDVAGSISTSSRNINIPNRVTVLSDIYAASISNSIFTNSPGSIADEDDRITRLLQKVDSDDVEEVVEDTLEAEVEHMLLEAAPKTPDEATFQKPTSESFEESVTMGNSIIGRQSWSEPSVDQEEEQPNVVLCSRSTSVKSVIVDNQSFESLWNEKKRRATSNFKEVWERFEKSLNTQEAAAGTTDDDDDASESFEVIKSPLSDKGAIQELQQMVEVLSRLSTECGLDSQGFLCKECKAPLGVDFSKATVCGFDGHYYCTSCISADKFPIPAKIIYNWDFKHHAVSKKAATFLTEYQFKPFIDFKVSHPITSRC